MFPQWLVAFSGRDTIVIYPGGGNAIVLDASTLVYVRERAALSLGWVDPCAIPPTEPGSQEWRRVQLDGFSMSLPPDYHEVEVQGKDAYVGSYEASDSTGRISFGLGGFPVPLDRSEGFSRYGSCSEVIGGKEAKVISAVRLDGEIPQEYRYFLGAAWREVRPHLHLTLWGEAKNLNQVKRLLAVLRTVRFEDERRYRKGEE